jgi:hypothetical protein
VSHARDERLEGLVQAVLLGDPGATGALADYLLERGLDPAPLRRRAEEGLAATHAELDDLLRQLREATADHLLAQADGVLRERAGWWQLLDVARRVERGG